MFDKFSPKSIIKDMTNIFHDSAGKKLKSDIRLFYLLPVELAICAFLIIRYFNPDTVMALLTSFSIFVALLLNLLVVLFAVTKNITQEENEKKEKYIPYHLINRPLSLKELHDAICFGILASFLTVIFLGIYSVNFFPGTIVNPIILLVIYYLSAIFILTMLLILKRVHILFGSTITDYKTN